MGDLSRRDLLTACLGAPLAAAACRKPRRIPDGELAFRPDELGHRVRDGAVPELGADRWQEVSVVVIGGGVAGLAAARQLRAAGIEDFVLLELEGAVGGTARSGANATSAFPWGAHYITAPMKQNAELLRLLRELGVVSGEDAAGEPTFHEQYLCREPQERVHAEGAWHEGIYVHDGESEDDKRQFSRFRAAMDAFAALRDGRGRRAFSVPVALGSDDPDLTKLDGLSMSEWMRREGFVSPRLQWLVDYACRDDFGARASQTSAWAGVHYYASRLLAPGREPQPVLTWPEGNGWLVARLLAPIRDRVRTGLAAVDVSPEADHVKVTAIGKAPEAAGFRAKRVVFAAPQMVARAVVRPFRTSPPPHLARFAYGAWMVANITLSARPRPRARGERMMAWDNVIEDSPSLGYVVATHQTGRDHGPTVLTYYLPLCDEDPREARRRLLAAGREEWADVALADLEVVHPDIRALASRVDVVRWGHAILRPSPGFFFASGARAAAAQPFRGVHFAHTDLSGVALFEEAFFHGTRAGAEVASALRGGGPSP